MNAFAHGRGKTQFSNMAFVFNPIVGGDGSLLDVGSRLRRAARGASRCSLQRAQLHRYDGHQRLRSAVQRWRALVGQPAVADAILRTCPGINFSAPPGTTTPTPRIGDAYIDYPNVVHSHHARLVVAVLELRSVPGRRLRRARARLGHVRPRGHRRRQHQPARLVPELRHRRQQPDRLTPGRHVWRRLVLRVDQQPDRPDSSRPVRADWQRPGRRVLLQLPVDAGDSPDARPAGPCSRRWKPSTPRWWLACVPN